MKKGIAFFDFDGTITTKDTLLEFIKFSKGTLPFYAGFVLYSPYLIAYKLKVISNQLAKEKILAHFFAGMSAEQFTILCKRFVEEKLPALIRPGALEEIREHQKNGTAVVIVSASPQNWISEWTNQINVQLMATNLVVVNGRITGKIDGKNCHGEEKVRRIRDKYTLDEFGDIYAYGDTKGDLPMLAISNHPSYRPFRNQ
ncbi:HAD-IB family hydrolase [Terrimonas sp. NA20]|uniref:HAD-IB family hydrolase n=1 Tax=Terrimonas ginsenosidimutans TaxID=2908004 RepID=A0ABS9KWZ8_9BACT|nr:HAD-IB family hydrolase [Terrimonas ginsenosidimutans]